MVYIQSDSERKLPEHFDAACAMYGAMDESQSIRLTSYDEVKSGKFDGLIKQNLFVGSTEFMTEVFNRIGKHNVRIPLNANRPVEFMTLEAAHAHIANGGKLFIKPVQPKLFTGLILDGMEYSCLTKLPPDTPVMTYEVFNKKIISEWRAYIYNSNIIDCRNYSGDFMIIPDQGYIFNEIMDHNDFPCAYTIDVGLLETEREFEEPEHVVIEYNDMWAIGNYGMPNELYYKLLKARYFEIINS